MKSVNFFSRIFCSGANMKSRIKFDELVEKYDSMTSEEIEKLIKNISDEHSKRWPSSKNLTFELEAHYFKNEPFPYDDNGHFWPTDNHQVSVRGPWNRTKNNQTYYYLEVAWRITGLNGCKKKMKEIAYKMAQV